MTRFVLIAAAGLCLVAGSAAEAAAKTKAPYPMAADGTTNIADCAKADVNSRNECISRSRPVSGKQLYAEAAASAKAAKEATPAKVAQKAPKAKAPVPAAVANVPKGFKVAKDGTTNVADCAKAKPSAFNECLSRARPLTGKQLEKYEKQRAALLPKTVAKSAAPKKITAAVPAAPEKGKGFAIAKDGTTNISDCAKAAADYRNECISRSRPVTGAQLYAASKAKS